MSGTYSTVEYIYLLLNENTESYQFLSVSRVYGYTGHIRLVRHCENIHKYYKNVLSMIIMHTSQHNYNWIAC